MNVCGILARGHMGEPRDMAGCVLPHAHTGPHECVCADTGDVYLWETEMDCGCDWCMQCEGDYCYDIWLKPKDCP